MDILCIAFGGMAGALARYFCGLGVTRFFGAGFPYATLTVNVVGSLLIGMLAGWLYTRGVSESAVSRGAMVGFLGAFTTFSTFALDNHQLLVQGSLGLMMTNILANVLLCLLAVTFGVLIARAF